jgi:hypothetical protein
VRAAVGRLGLTDYRDLLLLVKPPWNRRSSSTRVREAHHSTSASGSGANPHLWWLSGDDLERFSDVCMCRRCACRLAPTLY